MGLNPVGLRNGCTVGAATKNTGRLKKFGVIFPRCRKKRVFTSRFAAERFYCVLRNLARTVFEYRRVRLAVCIGGLL